MNEIVIPIRELYDPSQNLFCETKGGRFVIEHSLVSLSKWESKWHIPFLSDKPKTMEQSLDYIRCMTITQNVDPNLYGQIDQKIMDEINAYIEDPMTATWFNNKDDKKPGKEIITAELIYYWMITFNIPMECQKWHLNRLLTLIRVCDIKSQPAKKMGRNATLNSYRSLNEMRRRSLGTRG